MITRASNTGNRQNPSRLMLSDVISIRQFFARSANVERDAGGHLVEDFIPTPRALDVIRRIVVSLHSSSASSAFSVTGPYGSGKSSLAVFVDALLGPVTEPSTTTARHRLTKAAAGEGENLGRALDILGAGEAGCVRAIVAARREPVSHSLIRALRNGLIRYAGSEESASEVFDVPYLFNLEEPDGAEAAGQVLDIVQRTAEVAPLLIVIDEFGKNLEHYIASSHTAEEDLFVLQEIAERAPDAGHFPVVLMTLQHLAFEDYLTDASGIQRREWSKIQGRFADIPYVESAEHAQALISTVFERRDGNSDLESALSDWSQTVLAEVAECGLSTAIHVEPAVCYPLHPVALVALPELCSRYGQNERTLFGFLAGPDPLSVPSFLGETPWPNGGALPAVRLDRVYDFFIEAAPTFVGASIGASRWLEIETRIRDTNGLSDAEGRVLKTIGVLNLISAGGALRASHGILTFSALDGLPGTASEDDIQSIIESLEEKGLITYRGFADEYRVWLGSDIDLQATIANARRDLQGESLASLLNRLQPLSPVVASRHSQQTGTLRIFYRHFLDQQTEPESLLKGNSADGLVLLCFDHKTLDDWLSQLRLPELPLIAGVASESTEVEEGARELAAHQLVLDSAVISEDWVARRELRERTAIASWTLQTALDTAFGAENTEIQWIDLRDMEPIEVARGLSAALSALCDKWFPSTPRIRNEMLSRHSLTSQAARARRELLIAMVEHGTEEKLGIEGYGPERAMYEAILNRAGIHRPDKSGSWGFTSPRSKDLRYQDVWSELNTAFDEARFAQIQVTGVCERLMRPPFGLREGIIPILVTAALLARREEMAVYEEGTFVARLTGEVIERFAKNPDRFTIKTFAVSGARSSTLKLLAEALGSSNASAAAGPARSIVSIVANLLLRLRDLPPYARNTKRLDEYTLAIRAALLEAREPDELLFTALPTACGLQSLDPKAAHDSAQIREFASRVVSSIGQLESAYATLLDQIEVGLADALAAQNRDHVRDDLRVRALRIQDEVIEPKLRSFTFALSDDALARNEWLEYVAMVVNSKPASSWTDNDVSQFSQNLHELAAAFRRVEQLHFAQTDLPGEGFEAVRVAVTLPNGDDAATVLWVDEDSRERFDQFLDGVIERAASQFGRNAVEMLLARLSKRVLLEPKVAGEVRPDEVETDIERAVSDV